MGSGSQAREEVEQTHGNEEGGACMNVDLEALGALAAEKGISVDTLLAALADALESAYKRMPGASEYAFVTIVVKT